MPFSQWDDIAYSSDLSLFVAIGGIGRVDGGFVVTSTDGVTWTTQSGAAHNNWNRVAWLPPSDANGFVGRFVCGAWGGGTLSPAVFGYSNDGTSWTIPSFSDNISGVTGFAYSPELKLMVASLDHSPGALGDPGVYTTVDGITWTGRTTPPIHFRDVVWSSELGLFAAVGDATSDGTWPQVATSPDGVTWTARSCPIGQWQSVAWSPSLGLFVAVGMDSKGVLYAGDLRGVVLSAEAAIESAIMTSPDGITWTAVMPPPKMDLFSVAWSPTRGIFMATGRCREPGPTIEGFPSGILTSHDGVTWTLQPAPTLTTFDTAPVQTVTNTSWFGTRVLWVPALGKFISVVNTEVTNHFNLDTRNYAAAMTDGVEAASVTKYFLYQIRTVTYAP
jgi:hypothetical protein